MEIYKKKKETNNLWTSPLLTPTTVNHDDVTKVFGVFVDKALYMYMDCGNS